MYTIHIVTMLDGIADVDHHDGEFATRDDAVHAALTVYSNIPAEDIMIVDEVEGLEWTLDELVG